MPQNTATQPPDEGARAPSAMDRLRHLNEIGEIALVREVTPDLQVVGPRIQALSDHISAMETELAELTAGGQQVSDPDLTMMINRIADYRRELSDLCLDMLDHPPAP